MTGMPTYMLKFGEQGRCINTTMDPSKLIQSIIMAELGGIISWTQLRKKSPSIPNYLFIGFVINGGGIVRTVVRWPLLDFECYELGSFDGVCYSMYLDAVFIGDS